MKFATSGWAEIGWPLGKYRIGIGYVGGTTWLRESVEVEHFDDAVDSSAIDYIIYYYIYIILYYYKLYYIIYYIIIIFGPEARRRHLVGWVVFV